MRYNELINIFSDSKDLERLLHQEVCV